MMHWATFSGATCATRFAPKTLPSLRIFVCLAWMVAVALGASTSAQAQCPDIPPNGCCNGDVYRSCPGGNEQQENCAAFGQACGEPNGGGGFVGCFDPFLIGPNDVSCQACTPDCAGKQCGDDGCGGVCGTCGADETCNGDGQCQGLPNCNQVAEGCCIGDEYITCFGDTPEVENCADQGLLCGLSISDGFVGCQESFAHVPGGECPAPCEPQCDGKVCGDDGCEGTCGTCTGEGEFCSADQTQCVTCEPQCDGRQCGFDTCGGSCGTCTGEGEVCNADGQCEVPERTCENIPSGGCCESGVYKSCDDGDQLQIRCSDFDAQCGASWNTGMAGCYPEEQVAGSFECGCIPQCDGKTCGNDGCGGVCGTCALGAECNFEGQCEYTACPDVPNRRCCTGEALTDCTPNGSLQIDCAARNQYCGWSNEQNLYACVDQPGVLDDNGGAPRNCPDAPVCTPNCEGRVCGSDGCGGSCGTCADGVACDFRSGQCVEETACSENIARNGGCCLGTRILSCDSDTAYPKQLDCPTYPTTAGPRQLACGISNSTGRTQCINPSVARSQDENPNYNLQCEPALSCVPQCFEGDECGPDGCGGVCGVCEVTETCAIDDDGTGGTCERPCTPNCSGRTCGDNGCGGECGTCDPSESCQEFDTGESRCVFADFCNGLEEGAGCCNGRMLQTCNRGRLVEENCGSPQRCGWSLENEAYECGVLSAAADPAGDAARVCPNTTCTPNCNGRACGPDGCGGSCGTCPDGESCDIYFSAYSARCYAPSETSYSTSTVPVPPQNCCTDASGLPYGYPIGDTPAAAYHLTRVASGFRTELGVNACANGCGFDADTQKYRCAATGETLPATDPAGVYDATCPAPVCTPNCNGRACGDDGCGGSCGSCSGNNACYSGQCFSPCAAENDQTGNPYRREGRCHGSYLSYCEDGLPYEEDCSLTSGFCGWNSTLGYHSCGTSGEAAPSAALRATLPDCTWAPGTCGQKPGCVTGGFQSCPAGQYCSENVGNRSGVIVGECLSHPVRVANSCEDSCGQERESCSCASDCETDGDCCADYSYQCEGEPAVANCGDGFCFYDAGENCETCDSDCGSCNYSFNLPPWKAPFPLADVRVANGFSRKVSAAHPLDDVLPPSAPFAHEGLMMHLARPQLNLGPQGSLSLWDLDDTELVSDSPRAVPGVAGDAMRFWTQSNGTHQAGRGDIRWRPDGYLPRLKSDQEAGGLSVAMWVKVPTDLANTAVSTLWHADPAFSNTTWDEMRKCVAPRRGASKVTISCNLEGQTIKDIFAYAGEVDGLSQPSDSCQVLDDLAIEGGCHAESISRIAANTCVGRDSCTVQVPASIDGCERPTPPTVYVEAMCGWTETPPSKGTTFLVQPGADGNKIALNSVASKLVSDVGLTRGKWHHVAFTFQPLTTPFFHQDKNNGIARLFLDGRLVGKSDLFRMDRIRQTSLSPNPSAVVLDTARRQAASGQIGPFADVDEVMLYDRSLSSRDLSRMMRSGKQKLLRIWPASGADTMARNSPHVSLVPVKADHLVAAGARDVTANVEREDMAMRVAAGQTFTQSEDATHGLGDLNTYTAMAWVRKSSSSSTSSLMALGDVSSTSSALSVDLSTSCGGRGVVATFGGSTTLAQSNCVHGVAADQWALVAVTQSTTHRTIFVDGVVVARTALTASSPLFGASETPSVSFSDVDVYWSALFQKALTQQEMTLWFRSGPVHWTNGATYSPATATKQLVRDYASFAEQGETVQTPTLWDSGAPVTSGNAQSPLTLVKARNQMLTVPANAFFPRVEGTEAADTGPRRFSVVTRLGVGPGGPYPVADLVETAANGNHVTVFRADAYCNDDNACLIRGRARVVGPDVTAARDEMAFVTESFALGEAGAGTQLSVGLSFDGRHVLASLGGVASGSAATVLDPAERLAVTETLEQRRLPSVAANPASLDGAFFRLSAARIVPQQISVYEFRLYGRSMTTAELSVVNERNCENAGCESRGLLCRQESFDSIPTCMGCGDGQTGLSETVDGACHALGGFADACQINEQCASGACFAGRCSTQDRAKCEVECDDIGRGCRNLGDFLSDSEGQYQCRSDCKPFYQTASNVFSSTSEVCLWTPTTEDGLLCHVDDQCRSGACIQQATNVYKSTAHDRCPTQPSHNGIDCRQPADDPDRWQIVVRNLEDTANETINAICLADDPNQDLTRKSPYDSEQCPPVFLESTAQTQTLGRCAETDSIGCLKKNRIAGAHRVNVQGEDTSVYTCNQCLTTTFQGRPLYVKGWRMMKPSLCKLVREKIVDTTIDYQKKEQFFSYPGNVGADRLKKLLLNKTGAITPAEYAQFEKMGFGPTVLNFSIWPSERRNAWFSKWGKFLDLGDCSVNPGEATTGNPFFDPIENEEICVPNKFPNGTPCPPPGYNEASGDSPHSFCESGFCARDTGVCEEGFGTLEDTNGENRADDKRGSGATTALTQKNTSTLEVRQVGTLANGQTKKRRYTLSTVNDNQLKFFGRTQSILRMEQTMVTSPDDEESTYTGKNFLFGFQVPSSEPATRCPGASFEDGQWSGGDEECSRIKEVGDLKPALPSPPKVCLPSPWTCPDTPSLTSRGPMCVSKTFFAGPVPITVQAEVILDICLSVAAEVDDQTQEPSMAIKPGIGVVVELRGGVGGEVGPVELFAGVRAAITAVGLEFPISWSTAIEERTTDPNNQNIENLYVVKFQRKVNMDITILKLALGVFAEASIGWFAVEWEHLIFEFAGITLKFELASAEIESKKVDLDHPTAAFSPVQ